MKLLLLSDVHLSSKTPIGRLDDYRKTCLRKFEYVLKYAQKIDAMILQAGDLFDKPRDWFILLDVIKLLKKYECKLYCVYGQHDTYMYSVENREYTAMGVLAKNNLVQILDQYPHGYEDEFEINGISFSTNFGIPKFANKHKPAFLVAHATISDQAIYPGQRYYSAKKFLEDHPYYDLILCADIHRHFYFKQVDTLKHYSGFKKGVDKEFPLNARYLVNTGPMMRKEASHYNFAHEPCFYVYDTETKKLSRGKIPCEPAKKVLSRKHIESSVESDTMLETFIAAVRDDKMEVGANLIDNIHAFLKKNKIDKTICDILEEVMSRYDKEAE
jgi:predicted MPP superfamily phosphohydrolase